MEELKEKIHQNAKTSKEIAVYLHDALGFALPPFTKKKDVPKRIAELENQRWIPEKFVVGLVGGLQKQLQKYKKDTEKDIKLHLKELHETREELLNASNDEIERLEGLLEKTRKLVKKARIKKYQKANGDVFWLVLCDCEEANDIIIKIAKELGLVGEEKETK